MTDLNFVNSDCSLLDIQIVFSLFFIESPFTVYNDVQCLELDKCWPTSVTVGGCFDSVFSTCPLDTWEFCCMLWVSSSKEL